jgi:hypothetical protein
MLNKKLWEKLIAYFPLILHGPHRKRRLQQFFVAPGTCLASRCLATVRGDIKKHRLMGGIHVVRRYDGSGSMIFIKTGSGIKKLMGGGIHVQTHRHR